MQRAHIRAGPEPLRASDGDPWADVWRLARRQGGVLTRTQFHQLGISPRTVGRRVTAGEWRAVGHKVLVHGLSPDDDVTRALVAAHSVGVAAATLTGLAAIAVRGLEGERPWDALEESHPPWIITSRRVDLPIQVRLLRTDPPDADELMGVQVARERRVLLDLLRLLPPAQAKQLGYRALQTYPPAEVQNLLRSAMRDYFGHQGVARLRWLFEAATVNVHSDGEDRLAKLLRSAGIHGWRANALLLLAGMNCMVDFFFPESGLVVEVDSRAWHGVDRMDTDQARQNALMVSGYRVLRFSWWRIVNEPAAVVAEIRAALRSAA